MVLKPPAGMGASRPGASARRASWARRCGRCTPVRDNPVLAEEFLRGREYSFETITMGGEILLQSVSRYLPSCLEVTENPWIQWCCLLPRDIDTPEFDGARAMGVQAVARSGSRPA
jgi:hypothetical protein